jgi:hypothetical protein
MSGTIVVGVDAGDQDAAVLAWAVDQARRTRDELYVVHAYRPLATADRYWPRLVRTNDARRGAAQHVAASAVQLARARCPQLSADGSSIAGPVVSVLVDVSHVAELLVVGRRAGSPPSDVRRLAAEAACPVVFIGPQPRVDGPVVVLFDGDTKAAGFAEAIDFAFAAAELRGADLLVVEAETLDFAGDTAALAAQTRGQEELDMLLAGWQARSPAVAVAVELRRESVADIAKRAMKAGQLLVLASGLADLSAAQDCGPNQAAIAVVPTTTPRSSPCSTSRPENPAASSPSPPVTRTSSAASGSRRQKVGTGQT